jgi:hypothetical protein
VSVFGQVGGGVLIFSCNSKFHPGVRRALLR